MHVAFSKRPDGGSLADVDRGDGLRLQLRSYDRAGVVPHDAVHLLGERALGLTGGLWGSIRAGALFDSIEITGGRPRHDRRARSRRVRRENARELRLAEVVVGVLQQGIDADGPALAAALDAAWGITETGPAPFTVAQATRAVDELRVLRDRWRSLGPGEVIAFTWPDAPVRRRGRARA
ncbi:MAG TPA: hypothetical protein VK935_02080 [Actinomycetospora sp.]|nr:hypothetical protein [Actinomycetospora sp.]